MRLFLSGPVTGMENGNCTAFREVAETLRTAGHEVFNPAMIDPAVPERRAMRICLTHICDEAEGIVTLPGFCYSKGARVEIALAHKLDLPRWQFWAPDVFEPISHGRKLIDA